MYKADVSSPLKLKSSISYLCSSKRNYAGGTGSNTVSQEGRRVGLAAVMFCAYILKFVIDILFHVRTKSLQRAFQNNEHHSSKQRTVKRSLCLFFHSYNASTRETCALRTITQRVVANSLSTFRYNLSVPSSRDCWALKMRAIGFPKRRWGIKIICCVIAKKSAGLIHFAVEAWNHAFTRVVPKVMSNFFCMRTGKSRRRRVRW